MKNASAIARQLEQDLADLMARLHGLAGEIRQHIHEPAPRERVEDLQRLGRELSACLKRLRDPDQH